MTATTPETGVRQLFLDDVGIEEIRGLKRMGEFRSGMPQTLFCKVEHPWEKAAASVYGTAIYDPAMERFRLWYLCSPGPPPSGRKWVEVGGYRRVTNVTLLAYATSRDGVRWEKPVLNRLSFEGSTANNLVDIGIDNPEGVAVLFDPHDTDPARHYKALFWDRRLSPPDDPTGVDEAAGRVPKEPEGLTPERATGGIWVAFSPDGITWKTHGPVLPRGSDTTQAVVYDPKRKKYVAFGRFGFGRVVARSESDDFSRWSEPQLVLKTDDQDGPGGQIYGMPIDLYEGLYLGMFWMYREGGDARIDTQLAVSRDGLRWERVADRQTFLSNAPEGARDDGMSRAVGRYIVRGDRIYLYYSMVNGPHRSAKFPNPERKFPPAIGLVTLRRDGFASLDAGEAEGRVLTLPFTLPAGRLHVNADTGGGRLRVAACDAAGRLLPGFEGSREIHADTADTVVSWAGEDLTSLRGKTVRLRFTLQHGKLFSYWFER